ncbi:MAG: phage portal protein [Cenarchaeum sp. SB0669_bin_11]|nr:phage portal protein [Cenarchaeum sp. SB0669_bin_11]
MKPPARVGAPLARIARKVLSWAEGGYTDLALADAWARATAGGLADATLAYAAAVNQWASAFRALAVEGDRWGAITPALLASMGERLARRGEFLAVRATRGPRVMLRLAAGWDVQGGPDPAGWRYQVDVAGPSATEVGRIAAAGVVHVIALPDPSMPCRGMPLYRSSPAGAALWRKLEAALDDEATYPNKKLLLADASQPQIDELRESVRSAGPGLSVVASSETYSAGFSSRRPGLLPYRPEPSTALLEARRDLRNEIFAGLGVPPDLMLPGQQGAAQREAYRRFSNLTIQPVANLAAQELSAKLGAAITLNAQPLAAADMAGKARAYGILVSNGYDADEAAQAVGL